MKVLWHSTTPLAISGYGNVSRSLLKRLAADGHDIKVGTKHDYFGRHDWDGIEIFNGTDVAYCNEIIAMDGIDYIVTLWDIWLLDGKRTFPKDKWVAYVPVDTEWISENLKKVVAETGFQIAMSKHGERELRAAGFEPVYAPHGVDTARFRPKADGRKAFREYFDWDDETFVIGSVGLNYRDDRKGFIPLMQAFQKFHQRHEKSRLYLHTNAGLPGKSGGFIPYWKIATNLGIADWVAFPHQMSYETGRITEEWLCDVYNGFDVFCLPTRGEGFGLPLIDAQACGVPVIVSNSTTGPELCKTGWLIECTENDLRWLANNTWRYEPQMLAILDKLEEAYEAWRDPDWDELRLQARKRILPYDWDAVWVKYWKPIFKLLEERLEEKPLS